MGSEDLHLQPLLHLFLTGKGPDTLGSTEIGFASAYCWGIGNIPFPHVSAVLPSHPSLVKLPKAQHEDVVPN